MTGRRPFTLRLVAFLAMTLGLLAWTLTSLGFFSLSSHYRLVATFSDASGLLVGSEVVVAGVAVGRVEAIDLIDLDPGHRARVTFTVREGVRIDVRVIATIRSRTILGEKVIALALPPAAVGIGPPVVDGQEIPSTAIEADPLSLAAQAGEAMAGISKAVGELGKVAGAIAELREEINVTELRDDFHALADMARKSTELMGAHEEELSATLLAARDGASSLAATAERARAPLAKLDALLGKLEEDGTATAAGELVSEVRRFIDETRPELLESARALRSALAGNDGRRGLAEGLDRAATGAEAFFTDAGQLTAQLKHLSGKLENTLQKLERTLDNTAAFTPREVRKILQEEGVKVRLLE